MPREGLHLSSLEKALNLIRIGIPVFKVRVTADGTKTPLHENGHLAATLDPGLVTDWFTENPNAQVGAYMGAAGLVALDVDTKNGVDGWESLDEKWLEITATFGYDTPTGGRHLIYTAPEGVTLAPSARYRGMPGVDIRGGSSWVLWNGDVPASREEFSPAPEWMLDEKSVKSADEFTGSLKEWYDSLEAGKSSAAVRKAVERISDDMSHSDMVSATFEAIRLGAEGHAGIPDLLSALEDAWLSRDPGNHTTPEDRWQWKFAEALNSGIEKYGAAIDLRRNLPEYSLGIVPDSIPSSLYTGIAGDKKALTTLLRKLIETVADDMVVLSILWNNPVTKDIARDNGLEFLHSRITEERSRKTQVATERSEKRTVPQTTEKANNKYSLLTDLEREKASEVNTFIDTYLEASERSKGFVRHEYAVPLAWTALSMAFGTRAVIPLNGVLGVNLWFAILGYSGTGKTKEVEFAKDLLDTMFVGGSETYYNTGIGSPEGMEEALLNRDGLASMTLEDEAAAFYKNLLSKDWMAVLPNKMADWSNGKALGSQKVRLKELRGKKAEISYNFCTISTPDDTLRALNEDMFGTGFMARPAYVWGPRATTSKERYRANRSSLDERGKSSEAVNLGMDLVAAATLRREKVEMWGEKSAVARLEKAYDKMDSLAQPHFKYESVIQPAIVRLNETVWKCASLLALYRGESTFTLSDALVALSYVEQWYATLFRVSEEVAGLYQRDLNVIVAYVREQGRVARKDLMDRFSNLIVRNRSELVDRVDFLVDSGRLIVSPEGGVTYYEIGE
jgi:hypothetical protein